MLRRRPLWLLLSAVLLTAGCGDESDDLDGLRAELETREQAEAELAERLDELEAVLQGRDEPDTADPEEVAELADRLDDLASEVAALEDAVDAEQRTREEVAAELEATAGDLRSTLSDVQAELDSLRGELEDLRVRYEILQERVDEQSR